MLFNIADVCRKRGDLFKAKETYERVLDIYRHIYPETHPDIAEVLNNLGLIEKKKNNYEDAVEYYNQALEIYRKTLPGNHPKIAAALLNLGDVEVGLMSTWTNKM